MKLLFSKQIVFITLLLLTFQTRAIDIEEISQVDALIQLTRSFTELYKANVF